MSWQFRPAVTLASLNTDSRRGLFAQTLGIEITEVGRDFLVASLKVDDRHLRPGGIVNGGVYLAVLETLGSVSAGCAIDMEKFNALGVQVSANHLSTVGKGDTLVAVSKAIHIGRSTHVWEVNIANQDGRALSTGRITLLIVPRARPLSTASHVP